MPESENDTFGTSGPTETIPQYLWQFAQEHDALKLASDELEAYLKSLATEASIRFHAIEARTKGLSSFQMKADKVNPDGNRRYVDPASEIFDCVAARVIVFTTRARQDFLDLLLGRCNIVENKNPGDDKRNGYDSDHLVISGIVDESLLGRHPALAAFFQQRPGLEIQIRTVAGHAWAEYEHDVRYKSTAYQDLGESARARVDQWFVETGGLRRYLDQVFNEIDEFILPTGTPEEAPGIPEEIDTEVPPRSDSRVLDPSVILEILNERFSDLNSGSDRTIDDILLQLQKLEIETVSQLEEVLARNEGNDVGDRMDYPMRVTAARRLDDELLAALGSSYIEATDDETRSHLLRLRLRRVAGKFAIYVLETENGPQSPPYTGARAVRELTKIVVAQEGLEAAVVEDWIALDREDLGKGMVARLVKTESGPIFVATNLSRFASERLMDKLVRRLPEGAVRVLRAGDQISPEVH